MDLMENDNHSITFRLSIVRILFYKKIIRTYLLLFNVNNLYKKYCNLRIQRFLSRKMSADYGIK